MFNLIYSSSDMFKSARKSFFIIGSLLIFLGGAGILLPNALSMTIEMFLGWLMLSGGFLWAWYTYQWRRTLVNNWLKPMILIAGGMLLLVFPVTGIAAITLMISFYLIIDAFGSFALALQHRPLSGWFWMVLNGLLSLALALILLWGWPVTSPIYLGIIVGISLFFDGLTLFILGLVMKIE